MSAGLFLRNDAGRRGVPTKHSFQSWIAAIPRLPQSAQVNLLDRRCERRPPLQSAVSAQGLRYQRTEFPLGTGPG